MIYWVTPVHLDKFREELDERLQGYDNTFDKLKTLEDGHRALTQRLDELAEHVKSQPWSPEMEAVLDQLAADRRASAYRITRLTSRGSIAPSPVEIDGLMQLFGERFRLTKTTAEELTQRLDVVESNHTWLKGWVKSVLGVDDDWTFSSVFTGIFDRSDKQDERIAAVEDRVARLTERADDHELRLQALERQGKFSKSTFLITLGGLTVLGWLMGWLFFDAWVAGGLIGFIAGAIVGFALGSRKRSSRPVPPTPPVSTNPRPTPRS